MVRFITVVELTPVAVGAIQQLIKVLAFFSAVIGRNMLLLKEFMLAVSKSTL